MTGRRRGGVVEVVQSSAMDCGPAALATLLQSVGVSASYPRLREVCQTGVDGTSIDVLEQTACALGLPVEQVVVPAEFVVNDARNTPSIVVVVLPDGFTHFVVAWRVRRGRVVVMDPAVGRRVVRADRFTEELFEFPLEIPADGWFEWASSEDFLGPMRARLTSLGVDDATLETLIGAAAEASGWEPIAALDAATRAAETLVRERRVGRGGDAAAVVGAGFADPGVIPETCWRVTEAGEGMVVMRGAVVVRLDPDTDPSPDGVPEGLAGVLADEPPRPGRVLMELLGGARRLLVPLAMVLVAAGVLRTVEAWLFRRFVEGGGGPGWSGAGARSLVALAVVLLAVEVAGQWVLLGVGRRVEVGLRRQVLDRVPRLGDSYFRSRPASDMADRAHSVHRVRVVAEQAGGLIRVGAELVATLIAVVALVPVSWPFALALAVLGVAAPVVSLRLIGERDLRLRTLSGALSQFHLDALVGVGAVRAHRGEATVQYAHDRLFDAWRHTARSLVGRVTATAGVTDLVAVGVAAGTVVFAADRLSGVGVLLMAFWALNATVLIADLTVAARTLPYVRSTVLRLVEPLTAPLELPAAPSRHAGDRGGGATVRFDNVAVDAGGHRVLDGVSLTIAAGTHVGVVGASGSGKSTLLGVLLGLHTPAEGVVTVDGMALTPDTIARWRQHVAWVDPQVRVWNRSLVDNITYGNDHAFDPAEVRELIDLADLGAVAARVGDLALGEAGGVLSGGERQRVRLARALHRTDASLVVLDEAFRGLERSGRVALLGRAREVWANSTVLYASHDVSHTLFMDRVLVIDDGRVVEDGPPVLLAWDPTSRYRQLLDAEAALDTMWDGWRHLHLVDGHLHEICRP